MHWSAIALCCLMTGASAQLTAQTSVAPELRECYNNGTLLNRNNLPPTSISVLIDIIRRIEDLPEVNMDLRQLAVILLHTYRQDGIEYHQLTDSNIVSSPNVLPYAPTFHSYYRHKLLLTRVLPNNLQVLSNTTLPSTLKCVLHHMLSTSVDARVRGDESNCNQLLQYRALRVPRQASSIDEDVETFDTSNLVLDRNGQIRQYDPNDDVEFNNVYGTRSARQNLLGESTCPILDGVVKTNWGAVSAGNLIAGIAAGAQLQQIPLSELTKGSISSYNNLRTSLTSIYPSTLSGDIAEAVLRQGSKGISQISVGVAGSWNSTQATKHYMIHSRDNIEFTDPEIRGDIDGFVLGMNMQSILSTYSTLKLSQLLDMYYSDRNGVFQSSLRGCNRRQLIQESVVNTDLISETYAFTVALDTNLPLQGTIVGGLEDLVTTAVTNFQSYVSSNLNDVSCTATEQTSSDYRLKTNLYLIVDSTWQYQTIYPAVSYLLDAIDVNKYGSSVTLLSAFDGSLVVNKTFSLADFHAQYTATKHQSLLSGVNLQSIFSNVRTLMYEELEHEKLTSYVGGNSTVLLFLLSSANIHNDLAVWEEARVLNDTVPDLRILFATSSNQYDNLWNLVRDMHNDIKTVSLSTTNSDTALSAVIERIQQVGRRVVNSNCGVSYNVEWVSGSRHFDDYVEPGYTNFYAISPNYFYENNDNRKVRIKRTTSGVGNLVVCYSRVTSQPRQNSTSSVVLDNENAITCQSITGTTEYEISLKNACDGYYTINSCPPLYISVQSVPGTVTTLTASCTDNACRFPYDIKYQVQIEEFGCYSNAYAFGANALMTLTILFAVTRWL